MEDSETEKEQNFKKQVKRLGRDLSQFQQTVSSLVQGVNREPTDMETSGNSFKGASGSERSSSFTTANSNVSTSYSVGNQKSVKTEGIKTEPWEEILETHLKSRLEATCHIFIQQQLQKTLQEEKDSRELLVSENNELSGLLRYILAVVNSLHNKSLLFPEGQEIIKEVFTQLPTNSGDLRKSVEEATRMCQELALSFCAREEEKEVDRHEMSSPKEVSKQWEATEMEFVEGRLEKKRRRNEPSILERENLERREEEERPSNDLQTRSHILFSPKTISTVCSDEDTFGFPSSFSKKTSQNPPENFRNPPTISQKPPERFQSRRNVKTLSDSSDEDEDETFEDDRLLRRLSRDSKECSLQLVQRGDLGKLSLYSHHSNNNNKSGIQKVIKVPPSVASQVAAARFGLPIPLSSIIIKESKNDVFYGKERRKITF